jgi:hypothetical protein
MAKQVKPPGDGSKVLYKILKYLDVKRQQNN